MNNAEYNSRRVATLSGYITEAQRKHDAELAAADCDMTHMGWDAAKAARVRALVLQDAARYAEQVQNLQAEKEMRLGWLRRLDGAAG